MAANWQQAEGTIVSSCDREEPKGCVSNEKRPGTGPHAPPLDVPGGAGPRGPEPGRGRPGAGGQRRLRLSGDFGDEMFCSPAVVVTRLPLSQNSLTCTFLEGKFLCESQLHRLNFNGYICIRKYNAALARVGWPDEEGTQPVTSSGLTTGTAR